LNSWHDLPSIQPSCPNINTALTTYYSLKTNDGFAAGAPSSVSAKAKGGFEPRCMYRLLFARVQLHVFWKSLICIRPLDRLVDCRGPVGSTHAPLSH
jgi:hypothetical protein